MLDAINQVAPSRPWTAHEEKEAHCAVCLSDVEIESSVRQLPCGHVFHSECADLWLLTARKNCCPLCSAVVCTSLDASMRPVR